jgi:hypothetical protein
LSFGESGGVKNMALHYRFIGSFSTVEIMLDKADFLIALGEAYPTEKDTLAASAAIILAICLDQGTLGVLDMAVQTAQAVDAPREAAAFKALLSDSLRRRVVGLPELLTNSKFHLDKRSVQVRAIHDLITLRNDLMHVYEEADVSSFKDAATIKLPEPQIANPWLFVRLEGVREYRVAVGLYYQEVLSLASNSILADFDRPAQGARICEGKIVIRNPESDGR